MLAIGAPEVVLVCALCLVRIGRLTLVLVRPRILILRVSPIIILPATNRGYPLAIAQSR